MSLEDKAKKIIGDRQESYAPPAINFSRIARMWSVILEREVTPVQVALMMIALKITREMHRHSEDNLLDMIGYVYCLEEILNEVQE